MGRWLLYYVYTHTIIIAMKLNCVASGENTADVCKGYVGEKHDGLVKKLGLR